MSEHTPDPIQTGTHSTGEGLSLLSFAAIAGALAAVLVGLLRLAQRGGRREITPPAGSPKTAGQPQAVVQIETPARATTRPAGAPATPPPAALSNPGTRFSRTTKYVVGVILFLAGVYLVYLSRSVIPIVIFAALIAYLVHPIIRFLTDRLGGRKGLAVSLTYLLVFVLVLLIPLILLPAIFDAINFLQTVNLQDAATQVSLWLDQVSLAVQGNPALNFLLGPFIDAIDLAIQSLSAQTPIPAPTPELTVESVGGQLMQRLGWIAAILGPAVSAVVTVVFLLLLGVYFSLSGPSLFDAIPRLLPSAYVPEVTALIDRIGEVWASFLRGQLLLMVFIGLITYFGNLVLGTPQAILLALIAGFMELIPNIGPILATIPAVLLAFLFGSSYLPLENWVFALLVLAFYVLVQLIENQFAVPVIMGDAVDLPPLVVIIGVLVGASVAGVLGVFLATPIIATGREVFIYLYDKILEPEPVAEPPPEEPDLWQKIAGLAGKVRDRLPRLRRTPAGTSPEGIPVSQAGPPISPQTQSPAPTEGRNALRKKS